MYNLQKTYLKKALQLAYEFNEKFLELTYYEKLSHACMHTGETLKMKLYG